MALAGQGGGGSVARVSLGRDSLDRTRPGGHEVVGSRRLARVDTADPQVFVDACADVDRLRADIGRFEGSALETAQIWHQLLAMLLRLARERPAPQAAASTEQGIYRLFMRELDKHLDCRPSIRELAQRIGYSESTLSRACLVATGHSAKSAVDQRLALEAKRLLVHSEANVAQIATRLGFSEATNFIKFFRRVVETTPSAFRAAQEEFNVR